MENNINVPIAKRAEILIEALPYIQEYYNKIVVIKYGGNAMLNEELKTAVMGDILLLSLIGIKVVLVHGGGPEISDMLSKLGTKTEFIDGLRVTDKDSVEIVQMVLAGKINKSLVNLIHTMGGNAMGLCGIDGHMIQATKLDDVHGFVGEVSEIDPTPILDVLDKGYIPVIATVGYDEDGNVYNINADTAAAKIAGVINAESLISMTDIRGLLRDKDNEDTLIPIVKTDEIPSLTEQGIISGGMIPKMQCCSDAIKHGVHKVFILDGRVPHAILIEILTDEGIGTMVI